jgi:hypothetical protein
MKDDMFGGRMGCTSDDIVFSPSSFETGVDAGRFGVFRGNFCLGIIDSFDPDEHSFCFEDFSFSSTSEERDVGHPGGGGSNGTR